MGFVDDLRLGARHLLRRPGFTLTAVAVLALGVGVATTTGGIADRVLRHPYPALDDASLVRFAGSDGPAAFSWLELQDLANATTGLAGVAGYSSSLFGLDDGERAEPVTGTMVTAGYFATLGLEPVLGRFFGPDDGPAAVVLGEALWRRQLAADPSVVGRAVRLNGRALTVLGIAPAEFRGVELGEPADLWLPVALARELWGYDPLAERREIWLRAVGRLAPETSMATAAAEVATRWPAVAARFGDETRSAPGLVPIAAPTVGAAAALVPSLRLLRVVVAVVLLLAAANLGSLLLTRAAARGHELAVRSVLGAGPLRLLRLVLAETVWLAGAAALGAALLAMWSAELLRLVAPEPLREAFELAAHPRLVVLAGGIALALATGAALSTLPRLVGRPAALRAADLGGTRAVGGRAPLRRLLVTLQVAACLTLLVTGALLGRSLQAAFAVDPAFDTAGLLTVPLRPALAGVEGDDAARLLAELRRAAAVPGVEAASLAQLLPLVYGDLRRTASTGDDEPVEVNFNRVGPGFATALGLPLLAGRDLEERDSAAAPPAALVSRAAAVALWPDLGAAPQGALGRRLSTRGPEGPWHEVVGVVADARTQHLLEPARPYVYLPLAQEPAAAAVLLARIAGNPAARAADLAAALRLHAPNLPIEAPRPLVEQVAATLWRPRTATALLAVLGSLALALAAASIAAVVSFEVGERRRELGLRLALGAQREALVRGVVWGGLRPVLAGLGLGSAGAWLAADAASALLFGVGRTDPAAWLTAVAVLLAAAVVASFLPARQASRLDPIAALRAD